MQELSKATLEHAFREMGDILLQAGKMAEIVVYGGRSQARPGRDARISARRC
jgi:hypothetical protein